MRELAEMTMLETEREPETGNAAPRRRRKSTLRRTLVFGALAAVVIGVAYVAATGLNKPVPIAATPTTAPALTAHGTIEPVAKATVATMAGGVVRELRVRVGQTVEEGQVIARVGTWESTEVLVAPWRGTIMGLDARLGDTLMPGATVAVLGDLSGYQVETTDVDEYLISQIRPDQAVTMTVEALDGRKLEGVVDTVSLVQRTSSGGVVNYPVVIRLMGEDPDLRPGMTVRIVFP